MKLQDALALIDGHLKTSLNPLSYQAAGYEQLAQIADDGNGATRAKELYQEELKKPVFDGEALFRASRDRAIKGMVLGLCLYAEKHEDEIPLNEESIGGIMEGVIMDVTRRSRELTESLAGGFSEEMEGRTLKERVY